MVVSDLLPLIPDSETVEIWDTTLDTKLAEYNGRDSIPSVYNALDIEAVDVGAYAQVRIFVNFWSDRQCYDC